MLRCDRSYVNTFFRGNKLYCHENMFGGKNSFCNEKYYIVTDPMAT